MLKYIQHWLHQIWCCLIGTDLKFCSSVCPFWNYQYHLVQFNRQLISSRYALLEDLYNYPQHRNVIKRTFGVLKMCFKILQLMPPYKFRIQALVLMACCKIHNFITMQNSPNQFLNTTANMKFMYDNVNSVDLEELSSGTDYGGDCRWYDSK